MDATHAAFLIAGGLAGGVVNTLAGGGSLLTVPLLVLTGLPGGVANGTNRVGILVQSVVATGRFRAEGVDALRETLPVAAPLLVGAGVGAGAISQVDDAWFERIFGLLMLVLLVPTLWPRARPLDPGAASLRASHPGTLALFFGIGLYLGAVQAGAGIFLVYALSSAGFDLVRANAAKMIVVGTATLVALPVFVWEEQVAWGPALVLALGYAAGGALGARIAVGGGERVIRPVVALAVVALAGRMLGLY